MGMGEADAATGGSTTTEEATTLPGGGAGARVGGKSLCLGTGEVIELVFGECCRTGITWSGGSSTR